MRQSIPLERVIVRDIVKALQEHHVTWILKTHGSPYQTQGVPDLICISRTGRLLAIEVKRPRVGRATELQLRQIKRINDAGGVAGIATSPEEALELLELADQGGNKHE